MEDTSLGRSEDEQRGTTASERYLVSLARRSFLSIWSYANLYTDEGRKNNKGDGKELCDLVVVFGNNVLLFSDKNCQFPKHQNTSVAWARWYKRAVESSVRQLSGAENWIRRFPNRIFLDKHCSKRFPLPIPDLKKVRFFKFAVARGAYKDCSNFFGGRSTGSLVIDTAIRGSEHLATPFHIGHISPERGYVHVLDELTLQVVLKELDTISDLIDYIEKKEDLLLQRSYRVSATGEEQLVACYLSNKRAFPDIPADYDFAFFDEGTWEDFLRSPQYYAKKDADEISYAWDRLIEHFIHSGFTESGVTFSSSWAALAHIEPVLRIMASEPRVTRRHLAKKLVDALETPVKPGQRLIRSGCIEEFPDTAYLFLIFPQPPFIQDYIQYRDVRRELLLMCCKVAKLHFPKAKRIVGIATEPAAANGSSEDLILLETGPHDWGIEQELDAKEIAKSLLILQKDTTSSFQEKEMDFPDVVIDGSVPEDAVHKDANRAQQLNRAQRRAAARRGRRRGKHPKNR